MRIGQAFAIAFGLAFLILGGLYLVFRSESVAQKQRENPALPQPKGWLLVHRGFIAFVVAVHLYAGTFFLINGFPNYFVAVGAAIMFYAQALRRGLGLRFLHAGLRVESLANVAGGSLCAVGSVLHGGPIGALGAIGSLVWVTTWLWVLKTFWKLELEPAKPDQTADPR
jgi:hypothetical protein